MSTSGTYDFLSPQNAQLIDEAYERANGTVGAVITEQQVRSALRSINFILSSWTNKQLNLWTAKQGMLALNPRQPAYILDANVSCILEATIRTSNRALGGTAFSSAGGTAANAFDNNPNTACIQNAPDGYISYNWGQGRNVIAMFGVQSNSTTEYTLVAEYSNDNSTWFPSASIPIQTYTQGVIKWFVVPAPTPSVVFRIRETGGSTLNVQELYFNTLLRDTIISPMSRPQYTAQPQKNQVGRPSNFYFDRQIVPTVYLFPCPDTQFNNMYFTYEEMMQDSGDLTNSSQIPPRYIEPLTARLSHNVALKIPNIPLERIQYLKALADEEIKLAEEEDRERVPLNIYGNYSQGWTRS